MKIPTGKCGSYTRMLQMNPPVIKRLVVVICFFICLNENSTFKNALKWRVYENIVFPNSQGSTTKIKNVRNDDATVPYVVGFQCWSIISPPFLNLKITPNRATTENNTTQLHSRIT